MTTDNVEQPVDNGLDTYDYLIYARLNVELMFYSDTSGATIVAARGRPWKNAAEEGQMLIAWGYNAEEALENLAQEHVDGNWLILDWRFRPNAAGAVRPASPQLKRRIPPLEPDQTRPERLRAILDSELPQPARITSKRRA